MNIIIQSNNRFNNNYITYNNETHTIAEWSRLKNIKYTTLKERLKAGWSIEKALETPVRTKRLDKDLKV